MRGRRRPPRPAASKRSAGGVDADRGKEALGRKFNNQPAEKKQSTISLRKKTINNQPVEESLVEGTTLRAVALEAEVPPAHYKRCEVCGSRCTPPPPPLRDNRVFRGIGAAYDGGGSAGDIVVQRAGRVHRDHVRRRRFCRRRRRATGRARALRPRTILTASPWPATSTPPVPFTPAPNTPFPTEPTETPEPTPDPTRRPTPDPTRRPTPRPTRRPPVPGRTPEPTPEPTPFPVGFVSTAWSSTSRE